MLAEICHALNSHRGAATLALVAALSETHLNAQILVSAELQAAAYPRAASNRAADDSAIRGWASLGIDGVRHANVDLRGDLMIYALQDRRAFVDGEARLTWRAGAVEIAGGLLRESWGRAANSQLDTLGAQNTLFSVVHPQARLSQPTVRATLFLAGLSIDLYALAGHRAQPVPSSNSRLGFGVPTRDVVDRGALGNQSLAARLSGTKHQFDWSAHAFKGLNRRPTFVPHFAVDNAAPVVDAVYTDVLQIGGDMETTSGDWRLLAEGFSKRGAADITGQQRAYGHVAAAAEYQRFGAFGGAYDIIPRVQLTTDTRGDRADLPFASSVRAGVRVGNTQVRAVQIEMAYSYDWSLRGHGVIASGEKKLGEHPTLLIGGRVTAFSPGARPSVLDIWTRDLELHTYVRLDISR
jgi:hypothetical protein